MPNNAQPTDQQALALTHAIALQESGSGGKPNYNAIGDNGTSKGAYQWQPGNFEAAAKAAGLDPNDFSPENQDKVAYSEVKSYKDKGYDPGQISSLWNSGSPNNWQNHSGTTVINGKKISYDTPAYVKGVQGHYNQLIGAKTKEGVSKGSTNLKDLPGELAGAVSSLFPGKQLGETLGNSLAGPVGAISPLLQGNFKLAGDTLKAGLQAGAQANSSPQVVEKVGGDVAQAVALPGTLALGGGTGATPLARIANAGLKYGLGGAVSGAGGAAAQGGSTGQVATQGLIGGGIGALGGAGGQALGEAISAFQKPEEWQAVQEKITPKMSASEGRTAMSEGRVTRGTSSLLGGKTPDIVAPSPTVQENTATILKNIPNAATLNDAQLSDALLDKNTEIAQELKPMMEAIPIDQSVTGQAFDEWSQVKQAQLDDPEFYDHPGNKNFQSQFERRLNTLQWDIQDSETGKIKAPTPKTLDDIWTARKEYDASIPQYVKSATTRSPAQYIYRQQMWLQNRAILNDLLKQTAISLPKSIQNIFSDMSNMYDARQTLINNTKIDLKGAEGLGKKALLKIGGALGTAGSIGLGVGGLIEHFLGSNGPGQ